MITASEIKRKKVVSRKWRKCAVILKKEKKCLRMKFFAYNPILSNRRLRWKKRIEE